MVKDKVKFTLWLTPKTRQEVEETYRKNNCLSQSDFIEKAIRFYMSYLHSQHAEEFLPLVLADTLEGHLSVFGNRLTKLLYKQTVELDMLMNIIAFESDITELKLESLRLKSVRDVNRTSGNLRFADALKFQRSE